MAQSLSVNWGNTSRFMDLIPDHTSYWSVLALKKEIKLLKIKVQSLYHFSKAHPFCSVPGLAASAELSGHTMGPWTRGHPLTPLQATPGVPQFWKPKSWKPSYSSKDRLQSYLATNIRSKVPIHLDFQFQQMNDDSWTYGTLLIPGHQTFGNTIEGGKYHWSHFFNNNKKANQNTKSPQKEKNTTDTRRKFNHRGAAEISNWEGGVSSPISAGSRHKQCRKSLQETQIVQIVPTPTSSPSNWSQHFQHQFCHNHFFLVCIGVSLTSKHISHRDDSVLLKRGV